jgi:glycosyltransferase involved in cell wall biosynthesis
MDKSLPTIWMNVTTSENWHRPPVGIVRVEQSLCEEFSKLYGKRFKKCIWRDGRFIEALSQDDKFPASTEDLKEHLVKPPKQSFELPLIYPLVSRREALKSITQGVLTLTPKKVRPYLNKFLYSSRSILKRFLESRLVARYRLRAAQKLPLSQITQEIQNPSQVCNVDDLFSPGDVLISIGLDWAHEFYKEFYFFRKDRHVRVVTCCYDLIPIIYPQFCVGQVAGIFTSYFLDIADGSDLILCISRQTEQDLLNMLHSVGGPNPNTHVFPLGDNVPASNGGNISPVVNEVCKQRFILYVSTIERRKNHEVLYRAYHLLCKEGKKDALPKLLFVGMKGWGVNDLLQDIELDPQTKDLIVQLDSVTDSELNLLYRTAEFCIYPSLYEGWGLPVGEALSMGKVVISSDAGSLPEVGEDLVTYIAPWDVRGWADKIFELSTNSEAIQILEKRVIDAYKARTWRQAALSIYEKIEDI